MNDCEIDCQSSVYISFQNEGEPKECSFESEEKCCQKGSNLKWKYKQ